MGIKPPYISIVTPSASKPQMLASHIVYLGLLHGAFKRFNNDVKECGPIGLSVQTCILWFHD